MKPLNDRAGRAEDPRLIYTSHEGFNLANHKSRKLRVFDRKLEGSYLPFYCLFEKLYKRYMPYIQQLYSNNAFFIIMQELCKL